MGSTMAFSIQCILVFRMSMTTRRRKVVNSSPRDVAKLFIEQCEDQDGFFVDNKPPKGTVISCVAYILIMQEHNNMFANDNVM